VSDRWIQKLMEYDQGPIHPLPNMAITTRKMTLLTCLPLPKKQSRQLSNGLKTKSKVFVLASRTTGSISGYYSRFTTSKAYSILHITIMRIKETVALHSAVMSMLAPVSAGPLVADNPTSDTMFQLTYTNILTSSLLA
jgi:hypothetical protein